MVHVVYYDNAGKKGERVLEKILAGSKTMVVREAAGRKIPHSRVLEGETLYFMEKATLLIFCKGHGEKCAKLCQIIRWGNHQCF